MNNLIESDGIGEVTAVGWSAAPGLEYDEWVRVGTTLQTIGDAINWWVGDWLNYGERAYGEMYVQAIEVTGWKLDRLQQCKWVAGRVESCTRVQELSYTHHRLVAKLPEEEQAMWLAEAKGWGWRSGELREALAVDAEKIAVAGMTDEVPFSGSGHNVDEDAPEAVVEYEQQAERWHDGSPLPVLTWTAVSQVRGLVRAVLAGKANDAMVLANELRWLEAANG
tara:strand:- start:3015 stop:3683 length:669 start_codon:yes stop_codon:yes gene_type:complete